jgi:DNA-binding NarL/FixJ family response regulator
VKRSVWNAVPEAVRVAIVEDQREVREGLRFLVDGTEGYRCTGSPPERTLHQVTPHEVRLLDLLTEGHSYAAAALGSSVNTVAFHLKSIYLKLQVHSKSEAVAKALRNRIVR